MKLIESLGYHNAVCTPLMQRFLSNDKKLASFHSGFFTNQAAKKVARYRAEGFPKEARETLVQALEKQYAQHPSNPMRTAQLRRLTKPNSLTVTTGHQLNLFTGPLFFWYKIIEVICMAEQLNKEDKTHDYIPVFWMASEDHDIEEINHFFLGEQKLHWDSPTSGPVGRMSTQKLKDVYHHLSHVWRNNPTAKELLQLFKTAYLNKNNLAHATRILVDRLFGHHGLLIVDGDDPILKAQFAPHIKEELTKQLIHKNVTNTDKQLSTAIPNYKPQVTARVINLFYMQNDVRTRIVKNGSDYATTDNAFSWTEAQLLKEVEQYPNHFSPNALMRPLYQETVLPNVAYVGGGGELAYWVQLKSTFDAYAVPFPLLQLRKNILLLSEKQVNKCAKLSLPLADLFLPTASFINKRVRQISDIDIDFSPQRELLRKQFAALGDLAKQTDESFLGAVLAQEKKQLKGLDKLEKRLLKAQRLKLKDQVVRMTDMQHALFPNGILQERVAHFSAFLSDEGISAFGENLKSCMASLPNGLSVVQL
jgi:bacillithiol biosynthesis cysteine-adding enzyme BshC